MLIILKSPLYYDEQINNITDKILTVKIINKIYDLIRQI